METNANAQLADVRDPNGRGGMSVLLGGQVAGITDMVSRDSGEVVRGFSVTFFGGTQWINISDMATLALVREGSWVTAMATLVKGSKGIKIGERFVLDTIDGKPVKTPDAKPATGTKAA